MLGRSQILLLSLTIIFNVSVSFNLGETRLKLIKNLTNNNEYGNQYELNDIIQPKINETQINLTTHLTLQSLNNIDIVGNIFSGSVTVSYMWHDQRFIWNPDKYHNISKLILTPSSLWTPITFFDSYTQTPGQNLENVIIQSNGTCKQAQHITFSIAKNFNITDQPNDSHEIKLIMGISPYNSDQVQIIFPDGDNEIKAFGEYFIVTSSFQLIDAYSNILVNKEGDPKIITTIKIKRYSKLVDNTILIPAFFMIIFMITVLLLPINMLDKIPIILSLLIITVYQLMIVQTLPSTIYETIAERIINEVFKIGVMISMLCLIVQVLLVDKFDKVPLPKIYQYIYFYFNGQNKNIQNVTNENSIKNDINKVEIDKKDIIDNIQINKQSLNKIKKYQEDVKYNTQLIKQKTLDN